MRTIRIVNGVFGHRPEGSKYIEPKQAGDPPFSVDDKQAARLVALKVAVYVDEEKNLPFTEVATTNNEDIGTGTVDNIAEDDKLPQGEIEPLDGGQPQNVTEPDDELLLEEADLPERPVYNADMKAVELREIMDEYQLPFKVGMSKVDMVAALDDFFADEVEDDESADDMPDLGAEDPVV